MRIGLKKQVLLAVMLMFFGCSAYVTAQNNDITINDVLIQPGNIGTNWVSVDKGYISNAILKLNSIEFDGKIVNGYTEIFENPRTNQFIKINYYQAESAVDAQKILKHLSDNHTSKNYTVTVRGNMVFEIFNNNIKVTSSVINRIYSLKLGDNADQITIESKF